MDISAWLKALNLSQYEQCFRENDIEPGIVSELTADDLVALGISSVGHRRKLLTAISQLKDGAVPSAPAARSPQAAHYAERRQLTVMFVDLVGSTAMSARLDPEDMRAIIIRYQEAVSAVVTRFEGQVAKYMGDGVLCYFGWPTAHEDDAERAARAGMAVIAAVEGLRIPGAGATAARVGIATGLVVIGDLIGSGAAQEEAVVGETPNLAARLQSLANPGQVVIAEATHRLIGHLFEIGDLGSHHLAGFPAPMHAYLVAGERSSETRFEARSAGSLSAMVGRDHELALLLERWRRAKTADGQVVLLSGEPGIGKSRITRALIDAVAAEPHFRITYQCSPYHADSPLYPTIQQLTFAAGIKAGQNDDDKLDRLEGIIASDAGDRWLIASLLGLAGADKRYQALSMTPQQQRAQTLQALRNQLVALAKIKPVLFLIEDAHWIDATTLQLVDLCLDQIADAPVMILITTRPSLQHSFGGHPMVTRLALNRLARDQIEAIVARLTGGKSLPQSILDAIAAKTDGMPLFVEEFTKALLESGELRETGSTFELTVPIGRLTIPSSLYDSLMARLDRLQPIKEVAQTAACIGREFDFRLLSAIASLDESALRDALGKLVEAELVYQRGSPPDATYTFKHALLRDAAYDNLLKARREKIHARLVSVFEADHVVPELIAHHATMAGLWETAIDYWLKAGERASAQSANVEAVRHLERGLDLLSRLPEGRMRDAKELDLRFVLGAPLMATRGYAAGETGHNYATAHALCDRVGERERLLPILYGEMAAYYIGGDNPRLQASIAQFTMLSREIELDGVELVAKRMHALDAFHSGNPLRAKSILEEILAAFVAQRHRYLANNFGHDAQLSALCYLTWSSWILGYPEEAGRHSIAAAQLTRELKHANSRGLGLCWGATLPRIFLGQPDLAAGGAHELIAYSEEVGLSFWRAYGQVCLGWTHMAEARYDEARDALADGLAKLERSGTRRNITLFCTWAAQAELHVGNGGPAQGWIERGHRVLEETGDVIWAPELYRMSARLAAHRGLAGEAERNCRRAMSLARSHASRMLELRAASDLARLCKEQGRSTEIGQTLSEMYTQFGEGFGTPDLIEAKRLIDSFR